jgi:hypothetical protein
MEIGPTNRDRRHKPTDDRTIKDLAERYKAGASIRQLCAYTGWAYATVYARLKVAQVEGMIVMRPRGGVLKANRTPRQAR